MNSLLTDDSSYLSVVTSIRCWAGSPSRFYKMFGYHNASHVRLMRVCGDSIIATIHLQNCTRHESQKSLTLSHLTSKGCVLAISSFCVFVIRRSGKGSVGWWVGSGGEVDAQRRDVFGGTQYARRSLTTHHGDTGHRNNDWILFLQSQSKSKSSQTFDCQLSSKLTSPV